MAHINLSGPFGVMSLFSDETALVALEWGKAPDPEPTPLLTEAKAQLLAYFDRTLTAFDLPLAPFGTDFQQRVWAAMSKIPYGQVRTYGDLVGDCGGSARAIGTACGRNPLPILIPCHRVVGAGGRIGGYSGGDGPETKRHLLRLEGTVVPLTAA